MAKSKEQKGFTEVDFHHDFPAKEVAEHEIFMSFINDQHTENFYVWWDEIGKFSFQKFIDDNK